MIDMTDMTILSYSVHDHNHITVRPFVRSFMSIKGKKKKGSLMTGKKNQKRKKKGRKRKNQETSTEQLNCTFVLLCYLLQNINLPNFRCAVQPISAIQSRNVAFPP